VEKLSRYNRFHLPIQTIGAVKHPDNSSRLILFCIVPKIEANPIQENSRIVLVPILGG